MNAADIMTRFVVTVAPTATIDGIAKILAEHAISGVPVCEADGTLVGIVTESDLIRPLTSSREKRRAWWLSHLAEGTDLPLQFIRYASGRDATARDLMHTELITAAETDPVAEIAERMIRHDVKRVPILRDGKLVGIVSRADLVKTIARNATALFTSAR